MEVKVGKFYTDGSGKKVGPMAAKGVYFKGVVHPDGLSRVYGIDGYHSGPHTNLVSEWVDGGPLASKDEAQKILSEISKDMEGRIGKPTNPKEALGSSKIPVHLWPTTATVMGSMGLLDGMLQYGRSNYRDAGIRFSIYFDAAMRHMFRLASGEDFDPDSGLPHESHILACIAIIVDARAAGKLNDDREVMGGLIKLIAELTPHVNRLKERHKGEDPKHYTIADNT